MKKQSDPKMGRGHKKAFLLSLLIPGHTQLLSSFEAACRIPAYFIHFCMCSSPTWSSTYVPGSSQLIPSCSSHHLVSGFADDLTEIQTYLFPRVLCPLTQQGALSWHGCLCVFTCLIQHFFQQDSVGGLCLFYSLLHTYSLVQCLA